jgi:glycosyltransferase involved in cell wall biosynthesis
MKILHVGASSSPEVVDGINSTVWLVAKEQSLLGNQVTLLLDSVPDQAAKAVAEANGIRLFFIPTTTWSYDPQVLKCLLDVNSPDIVHMHSVFMLKQAALAKQLVKSGIPYMITPHALSSKILRRKWLIKFIYSWLIEKPRFYQAVAISGVTPGEVSVIRTFVPAYKGVIRSIPNPIDPSIFNNWQWQGVGRQKKLVYLGRFDVFHKGLDYLVEIARLLSPDIEIHLYGVPDPKSQKWLKQLQNSLPPNVYFHAPIFSLEKARILSEASLYIQMSRWEVFGVSVAEAMYMGVPCAIAETMNFAEIFRQNDLGIILSTHPAKAAAHITELINQPAQLLHWSQHSQAYARKNFQPNEVSMSYLKLYREAIQV